MFHVGNSTNTLLFTFLISRRDYICVSISDDILALAMAMETECHEHTESCSDSYRPQAIGSRDSIEIPSRV